MRGCLISKRSHTILRLCVPPPPFQPTVDSEQRSRFVISRFRCYCFSIPRPLAAGAPHRSLSLGRKSGDTKGQYLGMPHPFTVGVINWTAPRTKELHHNNAQQCVCQESGYRMELYNHLKTKKIDVTEPSYVTKRESDFRNKVYPQVNLSGNNLNRNHDGR